MNFQNSINCLSTTLGESNIDTDHLPILLIIGFAIFAGGLGAKLFQKMRIPQVVGYIIIGVILGRSGLQFISDNAIASLNLFNYFALGVIGFMIGGELKLSVFRKFGKQFLTILFAEGLSAFIIVTSLTFLVSFYFMGGEPNGVHKAAALALLLGSISAATAPAATVDVLWEYKTRGPLTTTVFAIVALDDGLGLLLYGIASTIAKTLIGMGGQGGFLDAMGHCAWDIFGALGLGLIAGILLNWVLRYSRDHDKSLVFIIGSLGAIIGTALALKVDTILSAMMLGACLVNFAPRRSEESFKMVEQFSPPIYVLFFVIVGARLSIGDMHGWMWALAIAFVVGRSSGKILGAYLGSRWSKAAEGVRKYLGLCLFSQAGVAIGLAILTSTRFPAEIGNAVVLIVTATTFIVQLIGPPCVKIAVAKAGEVGKNITAEDLMKTYTVSDVMDKKVTTFKPSDTFGSIIQALGDTDANTYPVVDDNHKLLGIITIEDLKNPLGSHGLTNLLVAYDLMKPVVEKAELHLPLQDAVIKMKDLHLEYLPVVSDSKDGSATDMIFKGLVEARKVDRKLSREIIRRQEAVVDQEQASRYRDAINRKKSQA